MKPKNYKPLNITDGEKRASLDLPFVPVFRKGRKMVYAKVEGVTHIFSRNEAGIIRYHGISKRKNK
jgi:hypothetical protein